MTPLLPTPLVSVDDLSDALAGPDGRRIVILDVSMGASAADPHIPGALRFDLDGPMSDQSTGLPHTMPAPDVLQESLRGLGISADSHVVVTETDFLFAAARPWWMLRAMGVDAVSILDGGNPAWAAGHRLVTEATPTPEPGDVVVAPRTGLLVDEEHVKSSLAAGETVIDARSHARFAGIEPEPRPGAARRPHARSGESALHRASARGPAAARRRSRLGGRPDRRPWPDRRQLRIRGHRLRRRPGRGDVRARRRRRLRRVVERVGTPRRARRRHRLTRSGAEERCIGRVSI
ncbi:3-mercaptopyruvate sulfurtransferase [Acidipropionibacterium acidipropionici ATCC 4875]|uniref:3-mercaptopyruvate sulfurtransferase n=1 Tax=Acidipropionibacterium acidipropionici (strain ATCC 4875 / DSM 20272 / JCM 6432 / NBRC 12425 / NCIMB 8070 / 4) TaxID=1171373 RepID=K7RPW9_ACIA4|nr:3-mercaptopyruvate sulfurtransferase [Acidipropionibacterium acidipropionici ATCC 4875]